MLLWEKYSVSRNKTTLLCLSRIHSIPVPNCIQVRSAVTACRITAYHKNGCQKYLNSAAVPRATNVLLKACLNCFMHLEFALVFHVFCTSPFGDLSEIPNESRTALFARISLLDCFNRDVMNGIHFENLIVISSRNTLIAGWEHERHLIIMHSVANSVPSGGGVSSRSS